MSGGRCVPQVAHGSDPAAGNGYVGRGKGGAARAVDDGAAPDKGIKHGLCLSPAFPCRQGQGDDKPVTPPLLSADRAPVGVHDGFGNGQAQAEAIAVGAGVVGAVKAVEKWGELVRRDIRPRSVTDTTARLPCRAAVSWIGVPGAAYFTALSSSTARAWPNLAPSPRTGRDGAIS